MIEEGKANYQIFFFTFGGCCSGTIWIGSDNQRNYHSWLEVCWAQHSFSPLHSLFTELQCRCKHLSLSKLHCSSLNWACALKEPFLKTTALCVVWKKHLWLNRTRKQPLVSQSNLKQCWNGEGSWPAPYPELLWESWSLPSSNKGQPLACTL